MIGIAGTDGKTTTTNMINFALDESFNTLIFSSLQDSLVIEGLVDLVVNKKTQSKDFAVFELPHGTIRMADGLELCSGVLTNLTPDHMDEFASYDEYIQRNYSVTDLLHDNGVLILNGDDPIITHQAQKLDKEHIFYGMGTPQIVEFEGVTYTPLDVELDITANDVELKGLDGSSFDLKIASIPTAICDNCGEINCKCGNFQRKYVGPYDCRMELKIPGTFNIENALATIAIGMIIGLEFDYLKDRIESFNGVKGRLEKIDNVNGINIFMDAAHNPESMEKLLDGLTLKGRLIISLDNPDTLTTRDKFKIGKILSRKTDVIITSAKNETTELIDWEAAKEVALGSEGTEIYLTETVERSIDKALEISAPGDTILHIGPGVVNAYQNVKNDIIKSISSFKASQTNIVVIGGCGTVGSLMARILKQKGADVTVSDMAKDTPLKEIFQKEGIKLDLGGHSEAVVKEADLIAVAPSLMVNDKLLEKIKNLTDADIISVDEVLNSYTINKPVIGITGTNGKTTTTQMLKNILNLAGKHVPEHYMDIQGNTELIPALQSRLKGDLAVVEIGTFGNPLEIKKSALDSEVMVGIITNISRDHMGYGSDFAKYINCKKEIVDVADILILNANDPIVASFSKDIDPDNVIFYGIKNFNSNYNTLGEGRECPQCENTIRYQEHYLGHLGNYNCICGHKTPEADVLAVDVSNNSFTLMIGSHKARVNLKTGGTCNIYNALTAASGALVMGIEFDDIVRGLEEFEGVEGRFQQINENPKIIMDYAHNPAGVKASLQTISTLKKQDSRLIVINTISSESGLQGDREIALVLNDADIVVPASFAARASCENINRTIIETEASHDMVKVGTLGASKNQVQEAIEKVLNISTGSDIVLIIGEGGVKYSKEILEKINI
nr:Mur ligase family protein [Methanobacterium alcaliphilum]